MSDIVSEINTARTNPTKVSQSLQNNLSNSYQGTQLIAFNKRIQTFQGIQAFNDMIDYLHNIKPTHPLIHSSLLSKVAECIAYEKGNSGKTQNEKPKVIYDLSKRYGKIDGKIGQLINLGAQSPQEVSIYFLLDDGLASRKRRRMLFDPQYKYIGVATSHHRIYDVITVIILAQNVNEINNKYQQSQVIQYNNAGSTY